MKKLNYFTAIKFLSKYICKHKKNFIMFYTGWFLDMLLCIAMPILFGVMIDEIVYYQNLSAFLSVSLVFVIMSIFSCILYFLIYAQHQFLMSMYVFDIQRDVFHHLQKADAQFLSNMNSGDIITTIQYYCRECMHFVIRNIIHFINGILNTILLITYVFVISWQIGLFMLIAVPISVLVSTIFGKKIRKLSDKGREYYGGYISWVYEIFSGIRDIRMLGATKKVNGQFIENHKKMYGINIKSGVSILNAGNIISGTNLLIQLAIFTFAAYLALKGEITIGLLTIIVAYFYALTGQVSRTSSSYLDAQNRVAYIQRIYDFMNAPTEDIWKGKKELIVKNGSIQLNDISFAYQNSNTVIQNLTLEITAGEHIALAGKSGCGKTTLAYMLIGFYRPEKGIIEIDGQKLTDCTLRSIRKNIGIIAQDVLVFDGSIKENLLLGNRKATDKQIMSACERAGLLEFITSLEKGVDTIIGTKGIGLSGGQKQRIAIARIYLKDPKIIIFDEATSSLDSETEEQIHLSWKNVLKGRTSIVIAHRQSSVMLCEKVAIIDNGNVIEVGDPRKMAGNSEYFKSLFAIKEGV